MNVIIHQNFTLDLILDITLDIFNIIEGSRVFTVLKGSKLLHRGSGNLRVTWKGWDLVFAWRSGDLKVTEGDGT